MRDGCQSALLSNDAAEVVVSEARIPLCCIRERTAGRNVEGRGGEGMKEWPDLTKAVEAMDELGDVLRSIACPKCGYLHSPEEGCVIDEVFKKVNL